MAENLIPALSGEMLENIFRNMWMFGIHWNVFGEVAILVSEIWVRNNHMRVT